MATVSVNTVRGYWNSVVSAMGSQAEALRAGGLDPAELAKSSVLSRYGGQVIEIEEGRSEKLTAENFDAVIATESDRMLMAAEEIAAQYSDQAVALLEKLSSIWAEVNKALAEEDERLVLPKLPEFRPRFKRGGGSGGGGGAPEARDWSAGSWAKTGKYEGWTLVVNEYDEAGDPKSFSLLNPDGEVIGDSYETASAAAMAAKEVLGLKGRENGPRWFGVPLLVEEDDDDEEKGDDE